MANFINKYLSQNDYENDDTKQYPNVSLVDGTLIYEAESPIVPFGGLTVKYNITNPNIEIQLFKGGGASSGSSESSSESGGGGALPTTMIVDGVEETPISTWRFETAGEHIVQYEFEDNIIPQDFITSVGEYVPTAKEAIIGTDITEIGPDAFFNDYLTSVTCLSTTPPYIQSNNVFGDSTIDYPIYVPAESVDTYKAATIWSNLTTRIYAIQ